MDNKDGFNPFEIFPKSVMLRILAHTFEDDVVNDFGKLMNYDEVSKELRVIIGDEKNFEAIMRSLPTEFNAKIIPTLRLRQVTNEEGRYRGGIAYLFLTHLYSQVKPYPNDEYLIKNFDYDYKALEDIYENFKTFPSVTYILGFVTFALAKRFLHIRSNDNKLKMLGGKLYKLAVKTLVTAEKLEHPLARLFHDDAHLQLVRLGIKIEDYIKGSLPKRGNITIKLLGEILSPDKKVSFKGYSEEEIELLTVTWQKLILEDWHNAKGIFEFAINYDLLMRVTEYFYQCYSAANFHRIALGYNSIFKHSECSENILWLFNTYKVKTLVELYSGYRVVYPKPDSILLSVILQTPLEKVKAVKSTIDRVLMLPHHGMHAWKMNFLDAYRDSVDDGVLKEVSFEQLMTALNYLCLVDKAGYLMAIMERDAFVLSKIFHCNDDKTHKIATALIQQVSKMSTFDPLGHLDHQEILLSCLYIDADILIPVEMKNDNDPEQLAKVIMISYKNIIAKTLKSQPEIIVPEFIRNNANEFKNLKTDLHHKFKDMGYLKSA